MKIDILMATYNGEKYIREQLESIINQSYKKWNLLIRDDNSSDKTVEIVKEYMKQDKRIKLIEDDRGNLGFLKNFEELLKYSKEKLVMFSDQDDYWLKEKIQKYIELFNRLSDEDRWEKPLLIHSNSFVCDDDLKILKKEFINSKLAKKNNGDSYFFYCIVQGSATMINRKMLEIGVPFLENVTLHDRYFHLISEFFGKRVFIDESLMKYRQHENNEIGAKKRNLIEKIMKKRYFDEDERKLIIEISEKYKNKIGKEKKENIDNYLKITNRKINRFKRLILSFKIEMNIKKRIFLILKG